jgi:hypothetical protein
LNLDRSVTYITTFHLISSHHSQFPCNLGFFKYTLSYSLLSNFSFIFHFSLHCSFTSIYLNKVLIVLHTSSFLLLESILYSWSLIIDYWWLIIDDLGFWFKIFIVILLRKLTMTIAESDFPIDNGVSCVPLSPEEEKRTVLELMNKSELNLKEGNLYFVISNRF